MELKMQNDETRNEDADASEVVSEREPLSALLHEWKLDDREVAWLWHYLAYIKKEDLTDCALNSALMRRELARRLRNNEDLKKDVEYERETQLLPYEAFQWIPKDGRQTDWLKLQLMKEARVVMLRAPLSTMTGKGLVISIFDTWNTSMRSKEGFLRDLKQGWSEHLQGDRIFSWFQQEDEKERCLLAWDWMEKNKPTLTRGRSPFTRHSELLAFFDRTSSSTDEKKHYIDSIKRRWSTQKHRENTTHKKQYNFVLHNDVNTALDKLAEHNHLSRTKILERLILSEAEHSFHLLEKSEK